jgi:hypothetical protein
MSWALPALRVGTDRSWRPQERSADGGAGCTWSEKLWPKSERPREGEAVHGSSHLDVAQDDIDVDLLLRQDDRSFIRACCFKDGVTAVPQVLADRHADQDIVFEDQDGLNLRRLTPV